MKVWVEEEFGFADYVWNSPFKTNAKLAEWWDSVDMKCIPGLVFGNYGREKNGNIRDRRLDAYKKFFGGEWQRVDEVPDTYDAYMHLHEEDDSCLNLPEG